MHCGCAHRAENVYFFCFFLLYSNILHKFASTILNQIYYEKDSFIISLAATGDGEIGMPDVMFIVNYILGNLADTFNADAADANQDGEIGMPDVMFIVNYILNGKFPDEE